MDEMIQKMEAVFRQLDIPYVVIGGIAASLLGKPQMTSDANIVLVIGEKGIEELINLMKGTGFSIVLHQNQKLLEE